ncbi:MAG: hypothetical protein VKI63_01230 [Cyanobium sp.]|nr:hypothetical protein [Cyanobium sp.]
MLGDVQPRADTPGRGGDPLSPEALQVLDLIAALDSSPLEQLQIALSLVRRFEGFHDAVVEEMQQDAHASHPQIVAWAIDAERLMHGRMLLENVSLD